MPDKPAARRSLFVNWSDDRWPTFIPERRRPDVVASSTLGFSSQALRRIWKASEPASWPRHDRHLAKNSSSARFCRAENLQRHRNWQGHSCDDLLRWAATPLNRRRRRLSDLTRRFGAAALRHAPGGVGPLPSYFTNLSEVSVIDENPFLRRSNATWPPPVNRPRFGEIAALRGQRRQRVEYDWDWIRQLSASSA